MLCYTAYDFLLPLHLLIYDESPYGPQRSRPHTTGYAGDVDAVGAELRFFLGILRIWSSRAGRELSIKLLPSEIARLDFENGKGYEFGKLFGRSESSWAGALAPARFSKTRLINITW